MPPDSPAAYTLVDKIRTTVRVIPGADAKVGGGSAINKDVKSAAAMRRERGVCVRCRGPLGQARVGERAGQLCPDDHVTAG